MGKVYFTGAGPGDIELLTVKAIRLIREADVIIYDRLVNSDILDEAKSTCERIYVGKANQHHTLPQEEINILLHQAALKHEMVVRLKGGDPFVFGRGGEEGLYLHERGIPFEFVPGVSSAIAVPEYAGIPVTHRGISGSVRIVSGHAAGQEPSQDFWEQYQHNDTIVFLMGLHRLEMIAQKLMEIGKQPDLPVAVISRGTRSDQRTIVGTLADIYIKAKDLPTPALIIVGDVVKLREKLKWFESSNLEKT